MGRKCVRCLDTPICATHGSFRLVHRDDLHETMWINQYVLNHYRPTKMTTKMCLRSVFHWNNETVNIWSHLLGFFYFSYRQYQFQTLGIPALGGHIIDHIVFGFSILGAQICMLLSAAYHTFGCSSPSNRNKWLKFDVFGISAGLLGIYLSGIYTAFFCFNDWLESYVYFLATIFLITIYVPSRRDFFDKKFFGSRIGLLHLIYTCLALFGLCPTVHWIQLHGGFNNPHVQQWLPNMMVLYGLTGAGFFFYASLIPERLCPGTFDTFGCSHQWWHLLILSAMVWWLEAGEHLLIFYRSDPLSCQVSTNQSSQSYESYSFNSFRTEL